MFLKAAILPVPSRYRTPSRALSSPAAGHGLGMVRTAGDSPFPARVRDARPGEEEGRRGGTRTPGFSGEAGRPRWAAVGDARRRETLRAAPGTF